MEFWSSVDLSSLVAPLSAGLASEGWGIDARFAVSDREYRRTSFGFSHLAQRAHLYAGYPLLLKRGLSAADCPEVAVVCTNTFYAPAVAIETSNVPIVHWVLDLFPEVAVIGGLISRGSFIERAARAIVRRTFDRASANVFLGTTLLAHAEDAFGPIPRAVVIPIGSDPSCFDSATEPGELCSDETTILYCGNFGRMHDFATVRDLLRATAPNPLIRWKFRGNGASLNALRDSLHGRLGLDFGDALDREQWAKQMAAADVALVTLRPGAEGLVMPSKTYSALAAGQAILAICPARSDLAKLVHDHDCGWVVTPGDTRSLHSLVERLPLARDERTSKRRAAWRAARTSFAPEVAARLWARTLEGALLRGRRG